MKRTKTGGGPAPKVNVKYEAVLEAQCVQAVEGFAGQEAETGFEPDLPVAGSQNTEAQNILLTMQGASIEVDAESIQTDESDETQGALLEEEEEIVNVAVRGGRGRRNERSTYEERFLRLEEKVTTLKAILDVLKIIANKKYLEISNGLYSLSLNGN
ncbi:uncharacterized protein [Diadema setosum]|uniref:uncharacterized protein n=1 Tax=Diadema setosum TaxID=31175 RepID=UPI003B3B89F3